MIYKLSTVARTGAADNIRPRILFCGKWLHEMGFFAGSLVQVLPYDNGMIFNLCDENIKSYAELYRVTKEQGGNLLRVCISSRKEDCKEPTFQTTGKYIYSSGLALGDLLISRCEYGSIRTRKVEPYRLELENVKVITVIHISRKYTKLPIPKVSLSGTWLNDIGFKGGSVAVAKAEADSLTLTLEDADEAQQNSFMKYMRASKMKIVQFYKEPHNRGTCIGITGSLLKEAGFNTGDTLAVSYEYGIIKLQKFDFEKLGF